MKSWKVNLKYDLIINKHTLYLLSSNFHKSWYTFLHVPYLCLLPPTDSRLLRFVITIFCFQLHSRQKPACRKPGMEKWWSLSPTWHLPGVTGWLHRSKQPETAGAPGLARGPSKGGGTSAVGWGTWYTRVVITQMRVRTHPPNAWHTLHAGEFTRKELEKQQEHRGLWPALILLPQSSPSDPQAGGGLPEAEGWRDMRGLDGPGLARSPQFPALSHSPSVLSCSHHPSFIKPAPDTQD